MASAKSSYKARRAIYKTTRSSSKTASTYVGIGNGIAEWAHFVNPDVLVGYGAIETSTITGTSGDLQYRDQCRLLILTELTTNDSPRKRRLYRAANKVC